MSKGSEGGKARAKIQKEEARQRIDNYNKNPNLCKFCNKPIYAPYDKKLSDTTRKKFCSKSCSAKFNNLGSIHNTNGINGIQPIIDTFTDDEIIEIFNSSSNIKDFSSKLGYKQKIHYDNKLINDKLDTLGLSLDDLRRESIDDVLNNTKGDLFNRYTQWQTARSTIQKNAKKIYDLSDKPKQCVVCGYDKHYEVAHIKAVSDFDNNALITEINNVDNLIALCPNHHWEYDNTDFDITPYLYEVI